MSLPSIENAPFVDYPFSKEQIQVPKSYFDYVDYVLIPNGLIQSRIHTLASQIAKSIPPNTSGVTMLCILKGAFRYAVDLLNNLSTMLDIPIRIEFLRLKSYANDSSTGKVQIVGSNLGPAEISGRYVLIVEDIIDTGRTIQQLEQMLMPLKPSQMVLTTLLWKVLEASGREGADNMDDPRIKMVQPAFVGFRIPDRFVIGYGMDYNELYRDLNHICVINKKGIEEFKDE